MTKELGIAIVKMQTYPMVIEIRTPTYVQSQKGANIFFPLSLFDVIKFEKTAKRQIAIVRKGGFRFPTNALNPVYQVASALHRLAAGKIGVRILIQKNCPPHKGLGSWSSASAGTLLALNKLWSLRLSERKLSEIANKMDPSIAKILKIHLKNPKSKKSDPKKWAIVVTPKLIEIDRNWIQKLTSKPGTSPEIIAENHFPDLRMIRKSLTKTGWKGVNMSRLGPAVIGFSKKKIGMTKIPKKIRSKLDFIWIGKACDGQFKLID